MSNYKHNVSFLEDSDSDCEVVDNIAGEMKPMNSKMGAAPVEKKVRRKLCDTIVFHRKMCDTINLEESDAEDTSTSDQTSGEEGASSSYFTAVEGCDSEVGENSVACSSSSLKRRSGRKSVSFTGSKVERKSAEVTQLLETIPESGEVIEASQSVGLMTLQTEEEDTEENSIEKLSQVEVHTWALPNFKGRLQEYLEDEDGDEESAIRSVLLKNGHDIGLPSLYLGHLYMKKWTDENQNVSKQNMNMVGVDGKEQERLDIFMEIRMKFVESINEQRYIHSHFQVRVHCQPIGTVALTCTAMYPQSLNCVSSGILNICWDSVKEKLGPTDPLEITIYHYVYQRPEKWSLSDLQLQIVKRFIEIGKIDENDKKSLRGIVLKCGLQNLSAFVECLNAAPIS